MTRKVGVALIGSGIFVQEEHLPAVQECSSLELKAIYSRSLASAKKLALDVDTPIDLYSDDEPHGHDYASLLERRDIHAVIIALPILVQPAFIKQALAAGKHVLAEKPIAKDITTATELLDWYHTHRQRTDNEHSHASFSVAEQFRFLDSVNAAAAHIARSGPIQGCRVRMQTLLSGGKYFDTPWRKHPGYQGGFVLDGGVHFVAAMRGLLRAGGGDVRIARVSAFTVQLRDYLPPVDTVDAALQLSNGGTGSLAISFGTTLGGSEYSVACERGAVSIFPDRIVMTDEDPSHAPVESPNPDGPGYVGKEVTAWAESLLSGVQDARQKPEEALADLEVIEAVLWSGENGGAGRDLKFQ